MQLSSILMGACQLLRGLNRTQNICSKCSQLYFRHNIQTSSRLLGVFEPDGQRYGPEIPEYDKVNIRIRAYDFVILESFFKCISTVSKLMSFEFQTWATPNTTTKIQVYRPQSVQVQEEFVLPKYERTVQLTNIPSTKLPIIIDYIRQNTPQGVEVTFKEFDEEEDKFRYVTDLNVKRLQEMENALLRARDERKKKKL